MTQDQIAKIKALINAWRKSAEIREYNDRDDEAETLRSCADELQAILKEIQ